MEKYLKENGGPNISEFDWGNGETPRRSERIIEKAKEAPLVEHESEPPKKRGKKSSGDIANNEGKSNTVDGDLTPPNNLLQKNQQQYKNIFSFSLSNATYFSFLEDYLPMYCIYVLHISHIT